MASGLCLFRWVTTPRQRRSATPRRPRPLRRSSPVRRHRGAMEGRSAGHGCRPPSMQSHSPLGMSEKYIERVALRTQGRSGSPVGSSAAETVTAMSAQAEIPAMPGLLGVVDVGRVGESGGIEPIRSVAVHAVAHTRDGHCESSPLRADSWPAISRHSSTHVASCRLAISGASSDTATCS
jgi:hypothetical protein